MAAYEGARPMRPRLFVAERRKASRKFDLYFIGAI